MPKSIQTYSGYDTFGRPVCLAKREDGVWFSRSMERTAYGMQWTRWTLHDAPTHPSKIKCQIDCAPTEYIDIPEEHRINYAEWGFNILNLCGNEGIRLPKDKK